MIIRILGAVLIVVGCGGVGFKLASDYIKQVNCLKQLLLILDYTSSELQYRLTPLPELCVQASRQGTGVLSTFFSTLAIELEAQISPDVERCVSAALYKHQDIPGEASRLLEQLGHSLGRFDLSGQLRGLEAVKAECNSVLEKLSKEKEHRVRNYKTLAFCAGLALAILFI